MNRHLPPPLPERNVDLLQARFGLRVAAALSEFQASTGSADIDERLRFARERAIEHARLARRREIRVAVASGQTSIQTNADGTAVFGGGPPSGAPWWLRLGSVLPLAVLVAGLVLIDSRYTRSQIDAAVEVDAAILADDLPPEAYRDQGFVEFLKSPRP